MGKTLSAAVASRGCGARGRARRACHVTSTSTASCWGCVSCSDYAALAWAAPPGAVATVAPPAATATATAAVSLAASLAHRQLDVHRPSLKLRAIKPVDRTQRILVSFVGDECEACGLSRHPAVQHGAILLELVLEVFLLRRRVFAEVADIHPGRHPRKAAATPTAGEGARAGRRVV
eukprot:CAMPEP_0195058858 /NCGR_PEP_ID=MMETSP0448-20130528/6517_1 /TAXON_ID=66468 /ORGANISM="Heterocapsa triquestra, Strain CCMP 448" /LENGTH=176 /DNA_ID=CAMNT_0040089039 /DNA_START=74 /DNA_END=605 /DNA_ORIENTATION=-